MKQMETFFEQFRSICLDLGKDALAILIALFLIWYEVMRTALDACYIARCDEATKSEEMIDEITMRFQSEYIAKRKPLNQWTVDDVYGRIKQWILSDLQYESCLSRTQNIFATHKLDGCKLQHLSSEDVKRIIKEDMLQLVTPRTLNIMCDGFNVIKRALLKRFQSPSDNISCKHIGQLLYNYPLNQLLQHIRAQELNGKKMIRILQDEADTMIQCVCGWRQDEAEQIRLLLMKEMVPTEDEFTQTISKSDKDSQEILNEIITIMDIEQLQYNIKNNHDTRQLSEMIKQLVDESIPRHSINRIYANIAECFLSTASHWVCCNCGNDNSCTFVYSNVTNSSASYCSLCGISHKECVIRKLKNECTIAPIYTACELEQKEEAAADDMPNLDLNLVETIVESQYINLVCRGRTDGKQCPSILRLAQSLIEYKEWIEKVYADNNGEDSIEQTTKIDIGSIDNKQFNSMFTACVQPNAIKRVMSTPF
eukprot:926930_1